MEGAFTHVGNHLISDSAAAIKAGADDLSALDPDESLLYGQGHGHTGGNGGRLRADDDDNQTEAFEEDDNDSLNSVPVDGMMGLKLKNAEEEKELPAHACACVRPTWTPALLCMLTLAVQILWNSFTSMRRQVPYLQQVVLQCPRQRYFHSYRQSPRTSTTQGSPTASRIDPWRYCSRMLQLRHQKRLSLGFYSCQIGYGGRPALSSALCGYNIEQGYELGYVTLGATH